MMRTLETKIYVQDLCFVKKKTGPKHQCKKHDTFCYDAWLIECRSFQPLSPYVKRVRLFVQGCLLLLLLLGCWLWRVGSVLTKESFSAIVFCLWVVVSRVERVRCLSFFSHNILTLSVSIFSHCWCRSISCSRVGRGVTFFLFLTL